MVLELLLLVGAYLVVGEELVHADALLLHALGHGVGGKLIVIGSELDLVQMEIVFYLLDLWLFLLYVLLL